MNTQKKYTILILIFLGIAFGGIFAGKTASSEKKAKAFGNMFNAQIKDVDYGQSHALAWIEVNGQDRIYSWGSNSSGQLGINSTNTGSFPNPTLIYSAPSGWYIVDMDVSVSSNMFWVTDGTTDQIYTWGSNSFGELGYYSGSGVNTIKPTLMNTTGIQGDIDQVVLGQYSSYIISSDATNQYMYSYGNNSYGLLGKNTSDTSIHSTPTLAKTLPKANGYQISMIDSQYYRMSMVINGPDDRSVLYAVGDNSNGVLGVGSTSAIVTQVSQVYTTPADTHITDLSMGSDSYGFVVEPDNGSSSKLYTVGRNTQGVLGKSGVTTTYIAKTPQLIKDTSNKLSNLQVDGFTMTALEKSATQTTYWGWGSNSSGQLGLSTTNQYYAVPTQLMTLDRATQDILITGIGNTNNSYVIQNYGSSPERSSQQLYAAGGNTKGELGTGAVGGGGAAGNLATLTATAVPVDYPAVANSALVIDETSITISSFKFTMEVVDPDNVFDPEAMKLYSGANILTTTYIGETSTDDFTYEVTELDPATTYDNFSVQLISVDPAAKPVSGSVTTKTPTGITLNTVTADPDLVSKTTVTFDIGVSLNDYQNTDIQSIDYSLEKLSTGTITTGTADVVLGSDSMLEFTLVDLDPGNPYLLTSMSLNYKDYTGSTVSTNVINDTADGVEFETIALDEVILNDVSLDSTTLTDTSAQFILDLNFGDYAFSDITSVQYTLTDSFTGASTVNTTDLIEDGTTYSFMVDNLNSANYYAISHVSLIYPDNNGVIQETNVWGTEPTEQLLFNTNVNQGVINSVEFVDNATTSTIDFIVSYSDLGSFNPEDLQITYSAAGVPVAEAVTPRLVGATSTNTQPVATTTYQYQIEDLKSGTIYSDFKFFLPNDVSSTNTNIYDYSAPTFEITEEMATLMDPVNPTNIDYDEGLTPDGSGVGYADFTISFIELSVPPQYIQASYTSDGQIFYPTEANATLIYVEADDTANAYIFRLIGLDRNKDYSDLKLYAPTEIINEGNGNYEPGYDNFQNYIFNYDEAISTKSFSNLVIILISFLAVIFLLFVAAGIYLSINYYKK